MQWKTKLKSIFGFFWNTVWQDTWLLQCIQKFFIFIFDTTQLKGLDRVYKQLSVGASLPVLESYPFQLLIPVDSQRAVAPSLSQQLQLGFQLGAPSGNQLQYTVLNKIQLPIKLVDKPVQPKIILERGTDFSLTADKLVVTTSLGKLSLRTRIYTIDGKPSLCYVLWGYAQNSTFLSDAYTAILGLPDRWLLLYQDSIKTAWNIQLKGPSVHTVKTLLGIVTRCPIAQETQQVLQVTSQYIKTPGHTYIIHEGRHTSIQPGEFIQKGEPLTYITDPTDSVYVYQSIPEFIQYIPVLTQVGYLKARNTASVVVRDNILPLQGEYKSAYEELCKARNENTTIPFAQLPATLNPASWIAQNVWKNRCYFICIPSIFTQDTAYAVQFILKNIPQGSIPLVLQYTPALHRFQYTIQPQIIAGRQILQYYNNSINNRHSYKESKDAITE